MQLVETVTAPAEFPAEPPVERPARPVCPECTGKGVIRTEHGDLPCPSLPGQRQGHARELPALRQQHVSVRSARAAAQYAQPLQFKQKAPERLARFGVFCLKPGG